MCGGVSVVTAGEVTVVRGDDGVSLSLLDVLPIPLTDTRTTRIGKYETTRSFESTNLTITLNGGANLFRTRCDSELALDLEAMLSSLLSNRCRAGHILVGRVGAGTDEGDLEFLRPVVLLNFFGKFGDGSGKIGGKGTVDVRLELGQILSRTISYRENAVIERTYDFNDLVVLGTFISLQVVRKLLSIFSDFLTLGSVKVINHAVVEGEERGGCTDFSTHVTNSSHTSAGQRLNTRTLVFDDSASTTLDCEDASNLKDDVCSKV